MNLDTASTPSFPSSCRSAAAHADAAQLHAEYKAGLDALGQSYELIYVLDGPQPEFAAGLARAARPAASASR